LRSRGVDAERAARIKVPAGLDIGAVGVDELALSIMAEIIQLRRAGAVATPGTAGGGGGARRSVLVPVNVPAPVPARSTTTESEPGRLPTGAGTVSGAGTPMAAAGPGESIDPVCGMIVEVATSRHSAVHDGRTFH